MGPRHRPDGRTRSTAGQRDARRASGGSAARTGQSADRAQSRAAPEQRSGGESGSDSVAPDRVVPLRNDMTFDGVVGGVNCSLLLDENTRSSKQYIL